MVPGQNIGSFNPCSNGSCSPSMMVAIGSSSFESCFNPCSNGSCSPREKDQPLLEVVSLF